MEFFPILIFIFVSIGIGASIYSQARKNKANQNNKANNIDESKPEIIPGYNAPRRESDPFAYNGDRTVNRTANANAHKSVKQTDSRSAVAGNRKANTHSSSVGNNTALGSLKDYKPITANIKSHAHTIGREENNIPTEESMGKIANLQGCSEHYYSRFVTDVDAVGAQRDSEEVKNALKTAIVLGEVINKPAFKRKDGRIR